MIALMPLEICTKTLQNFSEELRGKFLLSTLCSSMVHVSISCLVNVFWEIPPLKRSLVEGQQLQQKDRERKRKSKTKKLKHGKAEMVGWCLAQKLQTLIFAHARAKKSLNMILVKSKEAFCISID